MRLAILRLIPLLLVGGGLLLSTAVPPPVPAETGAATAAIDFEALHAQAREALARLQLARQNRVALVERSPL